MLIRERAAMATSRQLSQMVVCQTETRTLIGWLLEGMKASPVEDLLASRSRERLLLRWLQAARGVQQRKACSRSESQLTRTCHPGHRHQPKLPPSAMPAQ